MLCGCRKIIRIGLRKKMVTMLMVVMLVVMVMVMMGAGSLSANTHKSQSCSIGLVRIQPRALCLLTGELIERNPFPA
jgi:type IV secretory pathway protease TraF